MRLRRHVVAVFAALAAIAAALVVSQPQPVTAATGGTIRISLDAYLPDGTDFDFTSCQGADCGTFTLDDDSDGTLPWYVTGYALPSGTYTITQEAVPGWTLTGLVCRGGGTTTSLGNRRVTIALTSDSIVDCTFTVHAPSITIVQDTSPDGPADLSYSSCLGAGCGTFSLDDDTDATLPNTVRGTGMALGTYTVAQSPAAAWPLSALTCNTTTGVTKDVANRRVTIVLTSSTQHPTCTFANVTQSLTIVQDDLAATGQDHTFTGCSADGCGPFVLDDDAGTDATSADRLATGPIPPGTYTVTQDPVAGHELTGLTCPNETIDLVAGRATVTLAAGEHRTCTFTNRPTPAPLPGVAEIATSAFTTCARLEDGQARCWGFDNTGSGTAAGSDRPVVVSNVEGTGPLTGVRQIAGSWVHHCALLTDGTAACWGVGATSATTEQVRPLSVLDASGSPLTGITQISAGIMRTCVRLDTGEARCWGQNRNGELGDQTTTDSWVPVTVLDVDGSPLGGITQILTGGESTCAVLESTEVRCWGANAHGQLGDGTNTASLAPVAAVAPGGSTPLTGVRSLASIALRATCAVLIDRRAVCWGTTPTGQSGGANDDSRFISDEGGVEPMNDVVAISPGTNGTCFVTLDGAAWCMGQERALMANGPGHHEQPLPRQVIDRATMQGLWDAVDISVGWNVACAILASGHARCWGLNYQGEVGDGTRFDRYWAATVIAP